MRLRGSGNNVGVDHDALGVPAIRQFIHCFEHDFLENGTQPTCARAELDCFFGNGGNGIVFKNELHTFQRKQFAILFEQSVFRLRQNVLKVFAAQLRKRGNNREAPDKFRNHTELKKVFRLKFRHNLLGGEFPPGFDGSVKSEEFIADARADNTLQADKSTAADEENI